MQQKDQQETESERKTTVRIFQATNKWCLTREEQDIAKKGKFKARDLISSDGSTNQRHKYQLFIAKIDKNETSSSCSLYGDRD